MLIIVNCYTANLAAFLTINKVDTSIKSAEDLVSQATFRIGTVEKGSSYDMLKV